MTKGSYRCSAALTGELAPAVATITEQFPPEMDLPASMGERSILAGIAAPTMQTMPKHSCVTPTDRINAPMLRADELLTARRVRHSAARSKQCNFILERRSEKTFSFSKYQLCCDSVIPMGGDLSCVPTSVSWPSACC